MSKLIRKVRQTSPMLRILITLVIGAVLGILAPGITFFEMMGSVFVGALKAIAPILVFVLSDRAPNTGSRISARTLSMAMIMPE